MKAAVIITTVTLVFLYQHVNSIAVSDKETFQVFYTCYFEKFFNMSPSVFPASVQELVNSTVISSLELEEKVVSL